MKLLTTAAALLLFATIPATAQEPTTAQEPAKPLAVTPTARLAAAKTVYVRNGGGSSMPFDAISSSFADWGRFAVVEDPAKADILVVVTSPDDGHKKKDDEGGSGFSASAQGKTVAGRRSDTTAPESTRSDVLMVVQDAKTKATLWTSTEPPKGVEKGMSKEDKFVAAGVRLMDKFKQRVEPPPAQ
jgi:hypothetical protein